MPRIWSMLLNDGHSCELAWVLPPFSVHTTPTRTVHPHGIPPSPTPLTPEIPHSSGKLVRLMKDDQETSERSDRALTSLSAETHWQTPEYTVVETALEVTAYSLSTR